MATYNRISVRELMKLNREINSKEKLNKLKHNIELMQMLYLEKSNQLINQ